jgi:hypothetical protein
MSKLDWLRSLVEEVNQKHRNQGHTTPDPDSIESEPVTIDDPEVTKYKQLNTGASDYTFILDGVHPNEKGLKGIIGPSKLYRDKIVEPAHHVPFHESYPTFDKLNNRQLKWYLYWRQQLQKGIYADTSEGYIFLYVFELLNVSFESKLEKVVDMLIEVYDAYKDRVPRIATTLPSWIGDMYAELGAAEDAERWYEITSPSQFATTAFEIYDISDTVPPFSLWKRLLPEQTSFYKQHMYQIERCLEHVVTALDDLFRETKHVSLLQLLLPDKWVIEDARFYEWAVIERKVPTRRKVTYSPKYQGKGSTLDLLQACVRYIENHFRKEYGKKPIKVEHQQLTKVVQKVLDDSYRHFRLLYPKTEAHEGKPKKRSLHKSIAGATTATTEKAKGASVPYTQSSINEIQIDKGRVQTLKQESQWVLGAIQSLEEEIDRSGGLDTPDQAQVQEHEQIQEQIKESFEQNPPDTYMPQEKPRDDQPKLEDLLQVSTSSGTLEQLQEILDKKELAFVQWFQEQGRSELPLAEAREFIRSQGAMANTLLDAINEKALDILGDLLFEVDDQTVYWNTQL